jgi:tetratricopeptide (TPR) repeat protein
MSIGDYVKAVEDFNEILEAMPEWDMIYLFRAESHLELNNIDAAFADYKLALELGFPLDSFQDSDLEKYPEYAKFQILTIQKTIDNLEEVFNGN